MAPSQSQIVMFAAGSALVVGLAYTLYIHRRRNKTAQRAEISIQPKNVNQNANLEENDGEEDVPIRDDTIWRPLADLEGLAVSTSWAILNDVSSTSSPQLSPVESVASVVEVVPNSDSESIAIINGEENNNLNVSFDTDDELQGDTVLQNSEDDNTILEPQAIGGLSSQLSTTEHETVAVETIKFHYEQLLNEHRASELQTFTAQEITEALVAAQNPSQGLTERDAEVLVGMLTNDDVHLKHTALQGIANCATFTHNQNVLREKCCLPRLASLLQLQRISLWLKHPDELSTVSVTINAVTNLAANQQNNNEMEACVPSLVDISLDKDTGEAVCLSSLQALTNLSLTNDHHNHYTRLVQRLYQFLHSRNTAICVQALKILVNLSCNTDMVPHLLAAKAPEGLLDYLEPSRTDEPVILRFVTLLANILHAMKEKKDITSSLLPPDDKAASPETVYSALLGISAVSNLKSTMSLLSKHSNPELQQQAIRVYNFLK